MNDTAEPRTVTVGADGRAEGLPDRASVAFRVEGVADRVADARQRATDAATALFDVLAREGVPEEAVGTRQFSVGRRDPPEPRPGPGPHSDGDSGGSESPEYVAEQVVGYRTTDLDGLDAVVTAAVDDAGASVDRVAFGFRESTRRDRREAALADAMASARRQATTLADAEGLSLGPVRSLETSESHGGGDALAARHSTGGGSRVDLSPEREPLSARVQVTYELVDTTAEEP
jgi:hypothetical protein